MSHYTEFYEGKTTRALIGALEELSSMTSNLSVARELDIHFAKLDAVKKELYSRIDKLDK